MNVLGTRATQMSDAYSVLWWIPEGHRPKLWDAQLKLELLRTNGPGSDAFTFKKCFPKPSERYSINTKTFDGECPAF